MQVGNQIIFIISVKPSAPVGPVEFSDIQKNSVVITWKPSDSDGGSPITGYYIEMREAPKSSWKRVATVGPDVTTYNVPNMKEKEEHFFRVYAENKVGQSDALTSDGVTVKSKFGKKCFTTNSFYLGNTSFQKRGNSLD